MIQKGMESEATDDEEVGKVSQFESVERPMLSGNLANSSEQIESEKEVTSDKEVESKLISLTRNEVRKLLDLAKKDYPAQVYRLAIWLTILGSGAAVKQLSKLTGIPISSVYRTLKENGIFHSIGRPAKYYLNSQLRENLWTQPR